MSAETTFRAALVAYAPLVALVGQNVVQNGVEEGTPLPYVVFTTSHDPQIGLGGQLLGDEVTITVECWSKTALQADAVADAVTQALAVHAAALLASAQVQGRASGFDGDLGLDATVLSVAWST